jgi:gliding motility-associated-like protein
MFTRSGGTTSSTVTGEDVTVTTETSSDTTVNTTTTSSGTVSTESESPGGTTSSTVTGEDVTVTTETSSDTTVNTTTTSSGTVSTESESPGGTISSTITGEDVTVTTETSSDTTVNTTTTSSGTVSTESESPGGTISSTITGGDVTITTDTSSDDLSTEVSVNEGSVIIEVSQCESPTSEIIIVSSQGDNVTYTAINSVADQIMNLIFTSTGSITITGTTELNFTSETILINISSCQITILNDDQDSDQDNYSDLDEILNGTDVDNSEEVPIDSDNDNLSDILESYLGTNPNNNDSDGDGTNDGEDAFPLDPNEDTDTDGDGIGDNADPDQNKETENFPNQQINYGISPNGDGLNDTLELDFLMESFRNDISIYNTFGRRVYYAENYMLTSDRFDGRNQRTGNLLPQGTYFFFLNSEDFKGQKQKSKGFIYVNY